MIITARPRIHVVILPKQTLGGERLAHSDERHNSPRRTLCSALWPVGCARQGIRAALRTPSSSRWAQTGTKIFVGQGGLGHGKGALRKRFAKAEPLSIGPTNASTSGRSSPLDCTPRQCLSLQQP